MNRLPYESSIRSVERFSQLDSTNPTWVFSGIFAADSTLVEQRLRSFRLSFDGSWESANLETDFFAYLANLNLLQAVEHQDTWIQADSERDLIRIEDMVQC